MIADETALEALLKALSQADAKVGVLVDGFPRTETQVEFLKLFHEKMHELRAQFFHTPLSDNFRYRI